jgi:hypothetical protein
MRPMCLTKFNGSSAPIITSLLLAPRFFDKRNHWDGTKWVEGLPFAADWLIQLLTTGWNVSILRGFFGTLCLNFGTFPLLFSPIAISGRTR